MFQAPVSARIEASGLCSRHQLVQELRLVDCVPGMPTYSSNVCHSAACQ